MAGTLTRIACQFLHAVVDDVCGRRVDFVSAYPSLASSGAAVVVASYKELLAHAVNGNIKDDDLDGALRAAGVVEGAHAAVKEVFAARAEEVNAALTSALSDVAARRVTDFDWSVRLVLASGTAGVMRQPVMLLTLRTVDADGHESEIMMEMTKEKLDEVLASFGAAAAVVAKVKE